MSNFDAKVILVRRKLPDRLAQCLDTATASGYCREWSNALAELQSQFSDNHSLFRETLLVTQKLNRNYRVDQPTRKDINQLLLRSFTGKRDDSLGLIEKPITEDPRVNEEHIFVRFLDAVKDSYDTRMGRANKFALDFQCRLTSMKISFDSVRVLKNWISSRAVTPNFDEVPASDLRTIVDNLYILIELQFGSTAADIILSDAILTAETQAKAGQLSIRDLMQ
ncbi:MAG: hypothetical protein KTR18_10700 [Acidiferrobacterales bacterium]|nr:hypothetical protein [Acidiferrobacterales bacterium]